MHFIIEVRFIAHLSSHHARMITVRACVLTKVSFDVLPLIPPVNHCFRMFITWFVASFMQLETCWVTCLRCPESDERTTSSTRASLSMRIFCNATTCHPQLHLEDIRPLQPSSSWPQGSTRCTHIIRISYYCPVSMTNIIGMKCFD